MPVPALPDEPKKKIIHNRVPEFMFKLGLWSASTVMVFAIFFFLSETLNINPDLNLAGQSTAVCTDSDKGTNIRYQGLTKGKLGEQMVEVIDYCQDHITLVEYYCDFDECPLCVSSNSVKCPPGTRCIDGACS